MSVHRGPPIMHAEAAFRDLEHKDPRVRAQAADALGRAPEEERTRAVLALAHAAVDPHPSVRYAALLSLGELGAEGGVAAATRALADGEPLVREAATIALGQIGAGLPDDRRAPIWDALFTALAATAPEVRFQAVASLVEAEAPDAAARVRPLLDDADAKVRAQAATALGDAAGADRDALAAHLDDVAEVRAEAALALARLSDRRGVPALVALLADRDRALDAATALATLGAADVPEVASALSALLERFFGDPLVKVRAAEALARAGDPRGKSHLERAARARRDDVRGLAAEALGRLA